MKRVNVLAFALLVAAIWQPALSLADEEGDHPLPQVSSATWKAEYGSCRMLYHPGLLPER